MNPLVLKVLHIAAALGVFTALGAVLMGAQESCRKCASMLHGISLLLLLLIGFAMLEKPPMHLHFWKVKIVLWLFLGVAPVLARKKIMPTSVLLLLTLAAGAGAAWMGFLGATKSF
jgi:hypothetical protein